MMIFPSFSFMIEWEWNIPFLEASYLSLCQRKTAPVETEYKVCVIENIGDFHQVLMGLIECSLTYN